MSVLASKRDISRIEYAKYYIELYKYSVDRLNRVPKRKQKWICLPISEILNEIYEDIMTINNDVFKYGIKEKSVSQQAMTVINKLLSLQKPLITLWIIERYPFEKMAKWAVMINKEIENMARFGELCTNDYSELFIIDYQAMEEMKFLSNMAELHRFIYSKTISLPRKARDSDGSILMSLSSEALYRLIKANRNMPKDKDSYEKRKEDISIALNCLRQMQPPIFSLFLLMNYNEETMTKWADLLNTELKLLNGLITSDAKRFSAIY